MEFDPEDYDPKFNLIIGTKTMKELGIVLDFWSKHDYDRPDRLAYEKPKRATKTQYSVPNVQKY